ncbi:short-chain dehydrogenase/reductase-like protein [Lentithecium fluviatile CBS 122367]|uniref:Short-chain dehydrogenase/reductase-like protein n=1 Tax=Lentithecium fluviatile CBS 122367 TaxID=1168545 RepID=A0A6G1J0X2_9PLEO|nr:short-chain dehydrogenase/reductase-like protein [Lentithecium fluviatile CBS 122367]
MPRLASKTAIITGASSGIGRATALAFAREGANVVISDVRDTPLNKTPTDTHSTTTVQEVEKLGAKAIFVKCDVTVAEEVEALVNRAVQEFGRLDIMMNNAGIGDINVPIWDYPIANFDLMQSINLRGVFLGTKFAARQMKDQAPDANGDRGFIINVGSILGLNGTPELCAYVASKHGVVGLTKTAARDCAPHRIHVNTLCPGYTATSMTSPLFSDPKQKEKLEAMHPFRGLGTPEDLARAAVFLASEDAAWITGVALPVDGGYSCM